MSAEQESGAPAGAADTHTVLLEELRKKIAEAEVREAHLRDVQSRLVSTLSHEFRSPLTVIMNSAELIKVGRGRFSEEKLYQYVENILVSVEGLSEILDGVVFLGKTDLGKIAFKPVAMNLRQLCERIIDDVQAKSETEERRILLAYEGADRCRLDERLVRNMLEHLLRNALRFSEGKPPVRLMVLVEPRSVTITVRDEGIGIPLEQRELLYEMFHRFSNVGRVPGTGMGMPVVHRAVEMQGGTIELDSAPDRGTSFIVRLPMTEE